MRQKSALFVDFDNVYLSLRDEYDQQIAESFARNPKAFLAYLENGGHCTRVLGDSESDHPDQLSDQSSSVDPDEIDPEKLTNRSVAEGFKRDVLVRRVYLNPRGELAQFAPNFTASGYSLVECPSLTQQGKSAADIHMTIDILDCLCHRTYFDEFIILSADADFTPVLVRLREHNRTTAVYQSQNTSPAFLSNAHCVINQEGIADAIELYKSVHSTRNPGLNSVGEFDAVRSVSDILDTVSRQIAAAIVVQGPMDAGKIPRFFTAFPEFRAAERRGLRWFGHRSLKELVRRLEKHEPRLVIQETPHDPQVWSLALQGDADTFIKSSQVLRDRILFTVEDIVKDAERPMPLSRLGLEIGKRMGSEPKDTDWGGMGSLSALIKNAESETLTLSDVGQGYIMDPDRHTIEMVDSQELPNPTEYSEELASFIEEVAMLTNMPAIGPVEYAAMFEGIHQSIGEDGFPGILNLSKRVRDYCRDTNVRVARAHVNFVLNQLTSNAYFLDLESSKKDALAEAVFDRCLDLLERSNRRLSEREETLLSVMLSVEPESRLETPLNHR